MVVDSIHNNPVINVFVYFLSVIAETKSKSMEEEFQDSSGNYYLHAGHIMTCVYCSCVNSS